MTIISSAVSSHSTVDAQTVGTPTGAAAQPMSKDIAEHIIATHDRSEAMDILKALEAALGLPARDPRDYKDCCD